MRVGEAFPSNYLKASDLQGKRISVTIDHVAFEDIGRQKDRKPVVYFQGKDKGLVLNKTNASKITALTGTDEMDDWQGQTIILFGTLVEFGGEEVEGIRVAAGPKAPPAGRTIPTPPPPPPPELPGPDFQADDDDVPF